MFEKVLWIGDDLQVRRKVVIKIDDVVFQPYKWEMSIDGMYGHIYFIVKKDLFNFGSNNGAYCVDIYSIQHHEMALFPREKREHDIVHVATPCLEGDSPLTDIPLKEILIKAALFANENLTRVSN